MGADPVDVQSERSQVEGLENLIIGDLKPAAAPETPPRADVAMEVSHSPANSPQRADGSQKGEASDGEWQALPRQYELSDFQPIKKLYRGYASKVYLAEDVGKAKHAGGQRIQDAGERNRVVLKVYDLLRLSPLTKYQLDREIKIHSSVSHRNIVRLIAAFTQV
jgi:serine/threonine protein kinase